MTAVLHPLKWLALAGFACSLLVHALALLRLEPPMNLQPLLDWLGKGIFLVWVPTVLVAGRMQGGNAAVTGFSWRKLLAGCPDWMVKAVGGLFVYAFVNFFWTAWVRELPADGENYLIGYAVFTGHWMLFYGAAFAVMHSATRQPGLLQANLCPVGHKVGGTQKFCDQCGLPVNRDLRK